MSSVTQTPLQSRLLRAFVLQLILISIVTVVGVLAAFLIAERLLVNRALEGEAAYYWDKRARGVSATLPDTLNLSGFASFEEQHPPPAEFARLGPGQHRVDTDANSRIVHISERDGERLYLLFERGTVSSLSFYFGVLPLLLVLLTMYGLAYMTYQLSKRAVSPLSQLANSIENFDFGRRDANELDLQALSQSGSPETRILVDAIDHFVERSTASIDRERNFTRYASHELRTPLAVIQGSVSTLELLNLEGAPARAVERIKRTCKSMGDLLAALLMLAREQREDDEDYATDVNALLAGLLTQIRETQKESGVTMRLQEHASLIVNAPESVLNIVFGNLVGNALSYTGAGEVIVKVKDSGVIVTDTGIGMEPEVLARIFEPFYRATEDESGHQGLGLSIVKQTCANYHWRLQVASKPGQGTRFEIIFTEALAQQRRIPPVATVG